MNRFVSSIEGKSGILTGGTSGFGYAMARELCVLGASLAVFSADGLSAENKARLDEEAKGKCEFFTRDITADGASEEIVKIALGLFGRLDFVIVNAGFALRFEEPLLGISLAKLGEAMRAQFEIFPIAFASLSLAAARVMAPLFENVRPDESGHRPDSGSIVVTLSETSLCPLRDDLLAYAAAKRACLSVMETLSAVLGPKNIRVNGIAPGFANTAGPRKFYDRFPGIRADIEARAHLKPAFMDPAAIVPALLYLLTDNYVTGQVMTLDGGYHISLDSYFQEGAPGH